jgi:hypothetical protein
MKIPPQLSENLRDAVSQDEECYLIAGDYEEATDHIDWNKAKPIVTRYLSTLGLDGYYAKLCLDLLFSPRHRPTSFNLKGVCLDEEFTSSRGCPMGEPVTKSVLTILTKVAETLARRSVSPTNDVPVNHYFNSAGDD